MVVPPNRSKHDVDAEELSCQNRAVPNLTPRDPKHLSTSQEPPPDRHLSRLLHPLNRKTQLRKEYDIDEGHTIYSRARSALVRLGARLEARIVWRFLYICFFSCTTLSLVDCMGGTIHRGPRTEKKGKQGRYSEREEERRWRRRSLGRQGPQ